MRKFIVAALVLSSCIFSNPSYSWTQRAPLPITQCQVHAPYGFPEAPGTVAICEQGYFVAFDAKAKIPKYVSYEITPQTALGCVARSNAFATNQFVPGSATPDDYAGTGYDRGHASPDGDQSWDQQVEYESFLMTNMFPQAGSLNRGAWKLLETSVRGWAVQRNQNFTVYVGATYDANEKKIGNGVVVPHGFYKILINNKTNEVAAWLFPHVAPYPNLGNDLTKFRASVASIQKQSGVKYTFPKNAVEIGIGKEWPVNFGDLTAAKRAKCGKSSDN